MVMSRMFAVVLGVALTAQAQTAHAGFFELLFGSQPAARPVAPPALDWPAPQFRVVRPQREMRRERQRRLGLRHERRQVGPDAIFANREFEPIAKPRPVRRVKLSEQEARTPLGPFLNDPTLRRGDIVVTREGLRVFDGGPAALHRASSFRPLAQGRHLIASNSKQLAAIEKANGTRASVSATALAAKPAPKRERIVASD